MRANRSNELRKLILSQVEAYNISLAHLCESVFVDYRKFMSRYVNVKDLQKGVNFSSDKVIEIAQLVGLDIRMTIVIKDPKEFEKGLPALKELIKEKYDKRNNEKKRAAAKVT